MLEDILLKYRIRDNSVSLRNRSQQICTITYIRNQYLKKLREGEDNYSYNSYLYYLDKKKYLNKKKNYKVNYYFDILVKSQELLEEKKYFIILLLKLKVFLRCDVLRNDYISKNKMKLYLIFKNVILFKFRY